MMYLPPLDLLVTVMAASEVGAPEAPPVPIQTVILLVMLVMLGFIGKKVVDLGRTVRALEAKLGPAHAQRHAAPPAGLAGAAAPGADGEPSPEVVAVIAAAAISVYGDHVRIVSVSESPSTVRPWSLEGRREIFASHSIR